MSTERSAKKAARQAQRRHIRNISVKSAVKRSIRTAERLIADRDLEAADAAVVRAARSLDSAARKGVLHANNAARRKSRLMHKYHGAKVAMSTN